ncbi:fatty-acid-binding protein 2 [Tripterygium wilfordii]|uniref:Fatty-acid-binding protein 2 n=1 Tax=Tripterygium wilfordii TaxID=458696 RepID=A0A7J7DPX2_TRIWF|nr:fatty-acid-binding protein 2-like isoform X2 [Tripterygium wilfordii]KAF5748367.1 fatty-acid-binding protein 2 [Tripterygium wilfordii]
MDLDGGSSNMLPTDPFWSHSCRAHFISQFSAFVDHSLRQSGYLHAHGSQALEQAFGCMSQLAGALLCLLSSMSTTNLCQNISGNIYGSEPGSCRSSMQVRQVSSIENNARFGFGYGLKRESAIPVVFGKISGFIMNLLHREAEMFQSLSVLSLAAALIPPLDNLSSKVLAVPLQNTDVQFHGSLYQRPCEVENGRCASLSLPELNLASHRVEPRTGIEFPTILDNLLAEENRSSLPPEVLVGTGSKTMKIIKVKSLKVYAFGFYVHPHSVCEKLGRKYTALRLSELNESPDFYQDLLSAFEKSLRARLVKANPDTDFQCLRTFGSCFTQDIPLPVGTTIDFRRNADGQLITEIGGNQIGAVRSRDLCRAFFDMYIGDVPVSEQTKEEIGKNVVNIIKRC